MAFSGKNYDQNKRIKQFDMFREINDMSQGCLRTGSADMNLAYITDGKFGAAVGKVNKLWDVAAGIAIAKYSGAKVDYLIVDKEKKLVDYVVAKPSVFKSIVNVTKY